MQYSGMVDVYFATDGTGITRIIFHCEEATVGSLLRCIAYLSVYPVAYSFPLTADDFIQYKLWKTVNMDTQDHTCILRWLGKWGKKETWRILHDIWGEIF
jgi:hypothetical protein